MTSIIPLWLDLAAVGIGAFQGALYAIVRHKFDLVGVAVIAGVTGMGGGIIRDLLLGVRPTMLQDRYLLTVVGGMLAAILLGKWHEHGRKPVMLADSVTIGLYTVAGTYKGLALGASILTAILLGVITAVGGGVLRDLLSGERPAIFQGGPLYATAALLGSTVFVILRENAMMINPALIIAAMCTIVLRVLSLRFRWVLPQLNL